jgi:hypothetical protein
LRAITLPTEPNQTSPFPSIIPWSRANILWGMAFEIASTKLFKKIAS